MRGNLRIVILLQILFGIYGNLNVNKMVNSIEKNLTSTMNQRTQLSRSGKSFFKNSTINNRERHVDFTSKICHLFPDTCHKLENSMQRFFSTDVSEARGPKDLIAIVSTMLATLLGAILVKLNVLIVLSLISIGIGKILLIILTVKSHIFEHKVQRQPVFHENTYYPRRGYISEHSEYIQDDTPYNLSN